jgi:hypothetical protein
MVSTPDRDNRHARGARSNWRRWAILLGALILFVVAFDLMGRLVEPSARPGAEVAPDPASLLEPIRPEVTKLGRSGVRVVVDEGGYRLTHDYQDEAKADRLIACIEEGIATSPALTEGEAGQPPGSDSLFARNVRAKQVWMEVIRIHNGCTMDLDPVPPDGRPWSL